MLLEQTVALLSGFLPRTRAGGFSFSRTGGSGRREGQLARATRLPEAEPAGGPGPWPWAAFPRPLPRFPLEGGVCGGCTRSRPGCRLLPGLAAGPLWSSGLP